MAEERSATIGDALEVRLDRIEQGIAELKGAFGQMDKRIGELSSQLDKRLSSLETAVDKRLSSTETAVGDLRRDVRQMFYFVIGAMLVPVLIEVIKKLVQ